MNGLDLESFLLLLRADLGTWSLVGIGTLLLGLLVRVSWGSRHVLRKCLALSIVAHAGLALYGSTVPSVFRALRAAGRDPADSAHIRRIRVSPVAASPVSLMSPNTGITGAASKAGAKGPGTGSPLDFAAGPIRLVDLPSPAGRPAPGPDELKAPAPGTMVRGPLTVPTATPSADSPSEPLAAIRPKDVTRADPLPIPPIGRPTPAEVAELVPEVVRPKVTGSRPVADGLPLLGPVDLRRERAPERLAAGPESRPSAVSSGASLPVPRATPAGDRPAGEVGLADLSGSSNARNLTEVPSIYKPRLDANRSALAQRAGASGPSEQAVERALDWLARHQDSDGRWDGATARYEDGSAVPGDDDFTAFCPVGQTCFGECAYWEADTALTGLALLTYLGAGYTHKEGKYATAVGNGLDFLLAQQKSDGDLRGSSKAVGMYCHAMATLALCEAYALSLDEKLRDPAERAIAFLVRARARDGMAWRYLPGAQVGDTSILGWVVMALKSAREIGLAIPGHTSIRRGTLAWLDRVATGRDKGLARYQPWEPVTPTMTAEAWVCRQFLGVGGPGASSDEAAASLLKNESDRGESNFYYWYYGTLAMYQHGGEPWSRWNGRLRDRIIGLQRPTGHQAGSWDPDDSMYGARGGRIYCTALAALTLEVYYRYLRLYDEPRLPARAGADREALRRDPPSPATARVR